LVGLSSAAQMVPTGIPSRQAMKNSTSPRLKKAPRFGSIVSARWGSKGGTHSRSS
jgi:hypothetical protein